MMNEILKQKRNNNYEFARIGMERFARLGILPTYITAPLDLVQNVLQVQNSTQL